MKATEKQKQKMREYYDRNREEKAAYQRDYYRKHKTRIRKRTQAWWKRTRKSRAKVKRKWRLKQYGLTPEKFHVRKVYSPYPARLMVRN